MNSFFDYVGRNALVLLLSDWHCVYWAYICSAYWLRLNVFARGLLKVTVLGIHSDFKTVLKTDICVPHCIPYMIFEYLLYLGPCVASIRTGVFSNGTSHIVILGLQSNILRDQKLSQKLFSNIAWESCIISTSNKLYTLVCEFEAISDIICVLSTSIGSLVNARGIIPSSEYINAIIKGKNEKIRGE